MTSFQFRALRGVAAAAAMLVGVAAAFGQSGNSGSQSSPGFLNGLFGGDTAPPPNRDRPAQSSAGDLVVRIDRLEAQIRQLTGVIEQLQYRNQQLADQLRRVQEDSEYRSQELGSKGPASQPSGLARTTVPPAPTLDRPQAVVPPAVPPAAAPPAPALGRRGDAFDPAQNPGAPGSPRTLGTVAAVGGERGDPALEEPPVGAPGGRGAGEPLNLSVMGGGPRADIGTAPSGAAAGDGLPGASPRYPAPGGSQVATLPPSDSPKDNFDLAYGYILHKDYALAEDGFRGFLRKFPSDRLTPEAEYWLGESMFQRQRYRDAAETFLNVSTKYESTAKAPDALLRLGQSLAALGEKEAACASLGEVLRKYPRAALTVRQGVDREQKRVGC
jgi:tol-pal system protein YbgF